MKSRVRWIAVFLVLLLVSIASVGQTPSVHFIDVGQGDAILIDYGELELLIDGGRGSACSLYLPQYVDGDLEVVVATHMDTDHIGGLDDVFKRFSVLQLWTNGNTATTNTYYDFRDAYTAEGCKVLKAIRGGKIALGDIQLSILHPQILVSEQNDNSIVLLLSFFGWDFLFTGDISQSAEDDLRLHGILPDVDVLKVAHHGSNASSSSAFLEAVSPQISVISVGAGNQYGHPAADVLNRIGCTAEGSWIFQTDVHGTVIISVDSKGKAYYATEKEVPPIVATSDSREPTPEPSRTGFEIYSVEAIAECITLRNTGSEAADLGGWTISDGEGNYTFPRGTSVQAGATYKVCMDTYNPTHYTRGLYLNNRDDCVLLFPPDESEPIDYTCW